MAIKPLKSKRAIFFSIDAFVALGIIFVFIFLGYVAVREKTEQSKIHYDVLETLSTLKVGEFNNAYIQSLIEEQSIAPSEVNLTLLEIIGTFYISNRTIATNIANQVLADLDVKENLGIWYGPSLIASKSTSSINNAERIQTAKQFVTGICDERVNTTCGVTGFSARAFLSSAGRTKYTYLGGYVGDGNITILTEYEGNITKASLELVINKNFDLYINNIFTDNLEGSPDPKTPVNYELPLNNLHNGANTVELRGSNLYIAGGFLKISYNGNVEQDQPPRYNFPGINGIINLYDGFHVPGTLNNLKISLHYASTHEIALVIGNKTIYENSTQGNTTSILTNSYLSSILNYQELSNTTTPVRLWLKNISYVTQGGNGEIDIVLITDVSGSMDWRLDNDNTGTARNCNDPLLNDPSTKRISLAKCIDKNFVATILGASNDSRIALVSFSNDANSYTSLTRDQALLNNTINSYSPTGATCISCAINRAYEILQSQSSPQRPKAILVMSDGVTNRRSTSTCTDLEAVSSTNYEETIAAGTTQGDISHRDSSEIWNLISQTGSMINDIDLFNSTLGFAVGSGGKIWQWNGNSWSSVNSPVTRDIKAIDFYNSTFALAVGERGQVIKWNGESWSSATSISQNPTLNDISVYNSNLAFIGASRSNSGRIYKSTNLGSSWSLDEQSGSNWRGIKILSPALAFAVGNNGEIRKWNGASWSDESSPTSHTLYAIDGTSTNNLFAVGGNNGNARIISYEGNSWSQTYSELEENLNDIVVLEGSSFAVGDGGLVIEYETLAEEWERNFNIKEAYEGTGNNGISCTLDEDSCSLENSFPSLNAKFSSCRANTDLEATIYSIGFGPVSSCTFAANTLQSIASCGNGEYYASTNASELQQFYANIASEFIQVAYGEQTSNVTGNVSTRLYEDSYIEFNYTKKEIPFGLRAVIEQTFTNKTTILINIPTDAFTIDTQLASYSGALWTKEVRSNNQKVYNINDYGQDYVKIGDPYNIHIPSHTLNNTNSITALTGISPANSSEGSIHNKIIHTFVKNSTGYSPIVALAEGCSWFVEFSDVTNATLTIPKNYTGSNICSFTFASVSYEQNDALQTSTFNLLKTLDIDSDNRLDVFLTQNDIEIDLSQLTGVPFTWSTEVQVRTWT